MFVVFVNFFKFVFLWFFLFLNNYSLSYLILYSFSQRGLQKLYKFQAPQNLDPPLIMSLGSCDFRKNGCDRSHVLLNRVDAFLTYTLRFCQLSKNSVEETSIKVYWVIMDFAKIGAVNNTLFLKGVKKFLSIHSTLIVRFAWNLV